MDSVNPTENDASSYANLASFYEKYPYPAPVEDLSGYIAVWSSTARRRSEYHLLFPDQAFREDLDILVAGCGTSQAARHAVRWPSASVLGIDVSEASLRHTDELKRRHGLSNLETLKLAIEDVGQLDREFELIICTGVIHHLRSPEAALRSLRHCLRPDGALQLMVYAHHGRVGVSMMQEYIRILGIDVAETEIRDLAETLKEIPLDHPMSPLLRSSADFRSIGGIADVLMNPRDCDYTVPEFLELLDVCDLEFGRWVRQAPYRPQCGAFKQTPHGERLTALAEPEQFAALELLRGSMVRHSAIAYRRQPRFSPNLMWDDKQVLECVPIRLAETMIVTDSPPAGSAAVILNQSHQDTDLILPITDAEKRILDAIDDRSTIAEVAATVSVEGADFVFGFLKTLWYHDQITFDLSPLAPKS